MDVVEMAPVVRVIANQVFPVALLSDGALSSPPLREGT
ncbi:Uncharacterised protein [Acinetobacter baumannii]|nr:Uncharacterised protein [Acinetobacter baumannii]